MSTTEIKDHKKDLKPRYYYIPRFRHFNIYKRYPDGTEEKINEVMTRDLARKLVYKLNGWKEKQTN